MIVAISAFNWIAIKTAMKYTTPLMLSVQRFIIGSAALVPMLFFFRKDLPKDARGILKLIPFSLLYVAVQSLKALASLWKT
jgi:drug/metabolite transporter (DMT)-like permease